MANNTHFNYRRFVDLDLNGNEKQDENNYGYSIFNDTDETLVVGLNKADILEMMSGGVAEALLAIRDISSDNVRPSLLNSVDEFKGLYINDVWHESGVSSEG